MENLEFEKLYSAGKVVDDISIKDRILNIYSDNLKKTSTYIFLFIIVVLIICLIKVGDMFFGELFFKFLTNIPLIGVIFKIVIISFPIYIAMVGYEFVFGMRMIKAAKANAKELKCYNMSEFEIKSNFDKATGVFEHYLRSGDIKIILAESEFNKITKEQPKQINIYFIPEILKYKFGIFLTKYIIDYLNN